MISELKRCFNSSKAFEAENYDQLKASNNPQRPSGSFLGWSIFLCGLDSDPSLLHLGSGRGSWAEMWPVNQATFLTVGCTVGCTYGHVASIFFSVLHAPAVLFVNGAVSKDNFTCSTISQVWLVKRIFLLVFKSRQVHFILRYFPLVHSTSDSQVRLPPLLYPYQILSITTSTLETDQLRSCWVWNPCDLDGPNFVHWSLRKPTSRPGEYPGLRLQPDQLPIRPGTALGSVHSRPGGCLADPKKCHGGAPVRLS